MKNTAKPETIPTGGKQNKKVWAKLKSGLLGWKVEKKQHVQNPSATKNKHTSKYANFKTVGKDTNFLKCHPLRAVNYIIA